MDKSAPDPGRARTLDEFVVQLRALKVWAGDPSISRITRRIHAAWQAAGRPASELPARATVGYCLQTGRSRPNPDLLLAIVAVLVDDDQATVHAWRQALRVVMGEAEANGYVTATARLPDVAADFSGRADAVDRAITVLIGGGVCVVEGMAGIGKTALAVHVAHRLRSDAVVERVLFVDLRGYDPQHRPADPAAVLESLLRVAGVAGERIPHTVERRAAAFRRASLATRTLVVLDDAAGTEQLAPLLSAISSCPVLVTSRTTLADLPRAKHIALPALQPEESMAVLRQTAGTDRIDADIRTAGRIAHLLGHLPLALTVIGAHIRKHPDWPLTDYPPALTALAMEGGIRAALTLSDNGLALPVRRLLRLLALHPGADVDAPAAAALADQDTATTGAQLAALTAAHLLTESVPGRYTCHDLTRAFAAERARLDHPTTQLHDGLRRLFAYYTWAASVATGALYPSRAHHPRAGAPGTKVSDLDRPGPAEAWLDRELDNLLACATAAEAHGWSEYPCDLSAMLHQHMRTRGYYARAAALHSSALTAARASADRASEMTALNGLGDVHWMQGRRDEAAGCFVLARDLARLAADRPRELAALNGLGWVRLGQSRHEEAADGFRLACRLARDIGDRAGEVTALNGAGTVWQRVGRPEDAVASFREARELARAVQDRAGEVAALFLLGDTLRELTWYDQAADCYREARELARATGNRTGEANALNGYGQVCEARRRYREGAACFRQALEIARTTGNRATEVRALFGLGCLSHAQGRYQRSKEYFAATLRWADRIDSDNWRFEGYQGLGRVHRSTGRPWRALAAHGRALDLATALGQPTDEARAHDGFAHAHDALGHHDDARDHWHRALDILTTHGVDDTEEPGVGTAPIRALLAGLESRTPS